ncbi:hypothetical protein GGI12_005476, partial [Dipsacomyces acuminosporus]
MPMLQHLNISISLSYLIEKWKEVVDACKQAKGHPDMVNNSVQRIVLQLSSDLQNPHLEYLLGSILPFVPSLALLSLNSGMVDDAKSIMSDPTNSSKWLCHQVDIS